MPVIVIGADTTLGPAIIEALLPRAGELRAFVTDVTTALRLKDLGVKVAVGDVSDASHVGGAALNTFCAVVLPEAAYDDRERAFASSATDVIAGWAEGLRDAGVTRAIYVAQPSGDDSAIRAVVQEFALVDPTGAASSDIAAEVARLDDAATI